MQRVSRISWLFIIAILFTLTTRTPLFAASGGDSDSLLARQGEKTAVAAGMAALLTQKAANAPATYADSLLADRARENREIRDETISPFTATGQAVLHEGLALRVTLNYDTLMLGVPSADVGIPTLEIQYRNGLVYARNPLGGRFLLRHQSIGPVPMQYVAGDTISIKHFLLQVYIGANGARVMAFDPKLDARKDFSGLNYFPPDESWRVTARIERIAHPDTVTMPTSLGLQKHYLRYARLHFTVKGHDLALTLFTPAGGGEQWAFVPFTDQTTGAATYGGGRYLDVPMPKPGQETMVLDFNRAYNPYCAYTTFYNCPIPPAENELPIAVDAGEKTYGHGEGAHDGE